LSEMDPSFVEAVARKMLEQVGAQSSSPLMADLWRHFWNSKGSQHASKGDTKGQWTRLNKYRQLDGRTLAELRASEVTSNWVAGYREWRLGRLTRRKKAPAPGTVNRETDRAKAVLNRAVKDRLLQFNPLGAVSPLVENNVKQTKIRSETEFDQLLRACDEIHPDLRALCLAYMDSGLRRLEAIRLRWDELEASENGGGRVRLAGKRTKNKKPRQPRLTMRTFDALHGLPRVSDWVFANTRVYSSGKKSRHYGRPYSAFHMHRCFQKAVELSGLVGVEGESITFHTLRHSFAYRARRLWKWSEAVIMRQGGWLTRKAFERYGIVDDEELDEAMVAAEARIASDERLVRETRKPPKRAPAPLPPIQEVGQCGTSTSEKNTG
jgi:integrase